VSSGEEQRHQTHTDHSTGTSHEDSHYGTLPFDTLDSTRIEDLASSDPRIDLRDRSGRGGRFRGGVLCKGCVHVDAKSASGT